MFKILENWAETIKNTDKQIEKIQGVFNFVESDLTDSVYKLQCEYTKAVAKQVGDFEAHWLMWYWLDNGMGSKEMCAGYDGDISPVTGLNALEDLILEGAKR